MFSSCWLQIYHGVGYWNGRYTICSSTIPDDYQSFGNIIRLAYYGRTTQQNQGFSLSYTSDDEAGMLILNYVYLNG